MPLKKTVAMERRIDLASLFCLIARHGPAVLMALVLFGCLVAGFVMFKKMREKRRMTRRAAKRRDSNAGQRDAALGLEEEEEEPGRTTRSGSTDASDDNSLDDVKEHTYLSYGQVRQRRTASERKPYKHKVPHRETAIDNTQHAFFWEWDAHRTLSYAEEAAVLNLEKNYIHKSDEDVAQEVHGAKEPELIKEEEEEKMPEADTVEDLSTSNEDVSEGEFRLEETVPFNFNSQSCSCPTPNLSVNDRKENTRETNLKHLESELKDGTAPILVKENIISGPHKENKDDQENNTMEQNLECGESSCLNNERQAERLCNDFIATSAATSSVEIKEESLLVTSQRSETEPSKPEETKDESVLLSSNGVNFKPSDTSGITDSYHDIEQSHTQIDQSGCCSQDHHIAKVQTDKDLSTSQKDTEMVNSIGNEIPNIIPAESINISITDAITYSLDVNMAEDESVVHQETSETAVLSENTCLQDQQSQDIASQVLDGNKAYTDNSSDQKDITEERQTAPFYAETDANVVDCIEIQSVDSKQVECLAHPQPNQLTEVLDEETSQPGLPAEVKAEILSITDTMTSSNGKKENGMIHGLNTETTIPPGLDSDSKQAAKVANTNTKAIEIPPAMINDKIDCIVEQIVADAYKEVRQTSLEPKLAQLEEKTLEQPSLVQQTQESFGIDNENVASNAMENNMGKVFKKESKEVAFCSNMAAQITEEVVNTLCSLELSYLNVEHERQKDIVTSVASDTSSQINIDSNDMPMVKTVIHAQEINKDDEEKAGQETVKIGGNEVPIQMDTNLIQPAATEVKSLQLAKNISSEQMIVQPVPDNESIDCDKLAKDPIVKAAEQEKNGDVSSNMDTQIRAEKTNAASCQEVNNLAKVEGEILSGNTMETVENLETSMEKSQQKAPEMLADISNGLSKTESEVGKLLLTKEEDQPEIQPVKTEILENTPTSNEAEMKEPEMSSDTNNDVSSSIEKSGCKVVIVCRTLEASVSAVEMFDCEDIDGKTSHLELTSSGISPCQDYFGDKATAANEEFSNDVAASCDTLAEETATQETCKNSDLTSGSALDFSQDNGTAMKSMLQIELKDNGVSSPSLESGIFSMTVSPEMEEAHKEIGQIVVCDLPADFDPMLSSSQNTSCSVFHAEERVSHSLNTTDGVVTIVEEDVVSMYIKPLASSPVQLPAPDGLSNEVSVTNEDSFGSAIEERYQKTMEEVMMEVLHNSKSISDDMKKEEVKKVDEKKEQACDANEEEGEKADSEKTDISIMEATMDHNEWITDGSYQVLPWMNATSSKDATCSKQGVDLVENKPPPQASTTEDGTENAKKVLAVQPMPQNVNVTFRVHYLPLSPYQTVAVTGDQQELGAWKSVVPLEKTKDGYWSCVVGLPAESHVEWKFVVLDKGEVCRWEECGNRVLYTGFGDDLLVHKWWGFL